MQTEVSQDEGPIQRPGGVRDLRDEGKGWCAMHTLRGSDAEEESGVRCTPYKAADAPEVCLDRSGVHGRTGRDAIVSASDGEISVSNDSALLRPTALFLISRRLWLTACSQVATL